MNISSESRRSLTDPMLPTFPHTSRCDITHASRLAKAQAHRQFVTTCLRSNTIPWGLGINTRPHVSSLPDTTILQQLHYNWARIVWRASIDMLKALKEYHRRCEQYLKRDIDNEKNKAIQTLGQPMSEDILQEARAEYIRKKQKLEGKQQRKLNSLHILPSQQRLKQMNRKKKKDK